MGSDDRRVRSGGGIPIVKLMAVFYVLVFLPVNTLVSGLAASEGVLDRDPDGSVVRYGADAFWFMFVPGALVGLGVAVLVSMLVWVIGRIE